MPVRGCNGHASPSRVLRNRAAWRVRVTDSSCPPSPAVPCRGDATHRRRLMQHDVGGKWHQLCGPLCDIAANSEADAGAVPITKDLDLNCASMPWARAEVD